MYKENILRDYIMNSELRIYNKKIHVRMNLELAKKYDDGIYDNFLYHLNSSFEKINNLGIKYPGNSNPILYIYIVPDDSFEELLQMPEKFRNGKSGGRPVPCYDLDGFNRAYGLSQNVLENSNKTLTISREENEIHELAHLIFNLFKICDSTISEGFAEMVPLYLLSFEEIFDEHKNLIINLKDDDIFSAQELLNQEKNNMFGKVALIENRTCSFRISYISAYLFVRGCIEKIESSFNLNKIEATQYFLEILRSSNCTNEWLIYDIANAINIDKDELLTGKQMQLQIIKKMI